MCRLTEISGACDSFDFHGNTILVGSDDIGYNEYVFFSGFKIIKSSTEDKFIDFIFFMGNTMIPTAIAIREKYTYFICDRYKFIETIKMEERTLLNSTNDSFDPFDCHFAKCGEGAFKTIQCNQLIVFTRMKKLKKLIRRIIDGELKENWLLGLKNKEILKNLRTVTELMNW